PTPPPPGPRVPHQTAHPPADDQPDYANSPEHDGGNEVRVADVQAVMASQVKRDEGIDRVCVEVVERAGEDDPPHRRNRQHPEILQEAAFFACGLNRLRGGARRLFYLEGKRCHNQSRDRRQEEDPAPSIGFGDDAAKYIAEGDSDRRSEHENGYNLAALASRIEVADQRVACRRTPR